MNTTRRLHICSNLLSSRLVVVLVATVLSWQDVWAAPSPEQQAYLKASSTEAGDNFGWSVAVSGDTMVVGAPGDELSIQAGAAYIFVRDGTNWSQQARLTASNAEDGDFFGWSVAVSGDTVVVGAYQEAGGATGVNGDESDNSVPGAGSAYVFVRSGTNWSQQAYLKASNAQAGDNFGNSAAVSGNTAVIGAPLESSNATGVNGNQTNNSFLRAGAAYVFVRNGTNWSQQAYLKASNTDTNDLFARSVAVSGDTVVVGADGEDSNATGINGNQTNNSATSAGAAYVFVRNGTNWNQQAYLKASNSGSGDQFGWSVAVSGETVVAGAIGERSNATGVNGNQGDNSANGAGAAYVFVRSGTNWSQQAFLKASDSEASDRFGISVAVSGETGVVGAYLEDSDATGVNGDQGNNNAASSGAAYGFAGLGLGTQLIIVPDGSSGYFVRFNGAPELTYRLQRAASLTGPWGTIDTQTAPASGLIEYHDTSPLPGAAFYRTVTP